LVLFSACADDLGDASEALGTTRVRIVAANITSGGYQSYTRGTGSGSSRGSTGTSS
jgi:hypothetical protein